MRWKGIIASFEHSFISLEESVTMTLLVNTHSCTNHLMLLVSPLHNNRAQGCHIFNVRRVVDETQELIKDGKLLKAHRKLVILLFD